MIQKDRYSQAFLTMTGSALLSIYFLRNDKGDLAALAGIPLLIGTAYILSLFTPHKVTFIRRAKEKF